MYDIVPLNKTMRFVGGNFVEIAAIIIDGGAADSSQAKMSLIPFLYFFQNISRKEWYICTFMMDNI